MKLGAVTVLTKPFEAAQLREAVDASLSLINERHARSLRRSTLNDLFGQLTKGEWRVLQYLDKGLSNKVTASRLGVSVRTVEDRRRRIMEKLSADSVASVVHLLNEARTLGISLQMLDRRADDGYIATS
jgi:FixJ family two-component response regulator